MLDWLNILAIPRFSQGSVWWLLHRLIGHSDLAALNKSSSLYLYVDRTGRILIIIRSGQAAVVGRHRRCWRLDGGARRWRRVRMTGVVKEPAEGKLVEAVVVAVVVVRRLLGFVIRPQLLRVDGIEVGGVGVKEDARLVRGLLRKILIVIKTIIIKCQKNDSYCMFQKYYAFFFTNNCRPSPVGHVINCMRCKWYSRQPLAGHFITTNHSL